MAKPVLIGCSNVRIPADVDVQIIGVSNAEYDMQHDGLTVIREVVEISNSEMMVNVPTSMAVQPKSTVTTATTETSDPNTIVYFCDTSSNNITLTVYATSKHITVIKTSNNNTLTVVADTGLIDGAASINITYLSPKDVYFDGTNFWSK